MQVSGQLAQVVNPTGHIGIIGVYFADDPGGVDENAKKGIYDYPLGELWDKGTGIEMGQAPVKRSNVFLRDMIINGRAKPSFIVTQRLPLSRAHEAYAHFVHRGVGKGKDYTKVVLKPALDRAA